MAVPRPFLLLAVLAAALMAATFYAVRGARDAAPDTGVPAVSSPTHSEVAAPKPKTAPGHPKTGAAQPHRKAPGRSGARQRAHPAPRRPAGATLGVPRGVAKAIAKHRVVVLFFFEPGAADDVATARSVAALRGQRRVSVFKASARKLSDYRRLIGGLGISSVPSTVVVGRDRKAHVLEGFVDERTLAQEVADAKR